MLILVFKLLSVVLQILQNPSKTHPLLCQTPKMELLAKIVGRSKALTIFVKSFILDVWQGSEYTLYLIFLIALENGKFSIRDFFSKCDQTCRKWWIWSNLLKKYLQCLYSSNKNHLKLNSFKTAENNTLSIMIIEFLKKRCSNYSKLQDKEFWQQTLTSFKMT